MFAIVLCSYINVHYIAGKLVEADSSVNTMSVIASGKDDDLEGTFDCESNQHIDSATKIRRYVDTVT